MKTFVASFSIALVVSVILTPLVRWVALRVGAVDAPGGRHVHTRAVPRFGGVAIVAAFYAPLVGLLLVESAVAETFVAETPRVVGLFVGGIAMATLGLLDDARGVRASVKLGVQTGVAALAFFCGFRIDAISLPFIGNLEMGAFALPVTLLWIVGIVNAVNLIDGLDGLAAGVAFFAAFTNLIVAYISGSIFVALMMATMLGALVGFLFYNFNPARIFMGDSGSYFLGFLLASTCLTGAQKASTAVSLLVPIVALGVPIFDTLFAMVRRILERRSIFSPDRGHLHHRLLDMGITHRRAVLILYAVCVVFTASAIAISVGRSWQAGLALLSSSVVLIGLVRSVGWFEYLHRQRRQRARLRSRDCELLRRAVPGLQRLLDDADSEAEVLAAMGRVGAEAELGQIEVFMLEPRDAAACFSFRASNADVSAEREWVSARFPIGRDSAARAEIVVRWRSETDDVSPQAEILLQLFTDLLEQALLRVESPLAPRSQPEVDEHRPAGLPIGDLHARQLRS